MKIRVALLRIRFRIITSFLNSGKGGHCMSRSSGEEGVPQEVVRAIGARFRQYLEREWRGSQSALAAEVGVSQPAISRVACGEQLPSGRLLLGLRTHTSLNMDWLLLGQ